MTDVTQEKRLADLALAQERRHQEVLAKQSFKIWFKDKDARAQSDHAKWFNAWCDADALLTLQRPYGQPPDSSAVVSETPAPVGLGELGLEGPFAIAVPSAHRIRRTSQAAGQ
jgi:hypothetical protein